jgi:hypothetical protein
MAALVAQEPVTVMLIYIGGAMTPASSLLPLTYDHSRILTDTILLFSTLIKLILKYFI